MCGSLFLICYNTKRDILSKCIAKVWQLVLADITAGTLVAVSIPRPQFGSCMCKHFKIPLKSHLRHQDLLMFLCFVHFSLLSQMLCEHCIYLFMYNWSKIFFLDIKSCQKNCFWSCLSNSNSTFFSVVSVLCKEKVQWYLSWCVLAVNSTNNGLYSVCEMGNGKRASEFYQCCSKSGCAFQFGFNQGWVCRELLL